MVVLEAALICRVDRKTGIKATAIATIADVLRTHHAAKVASFKNKNITKYFFENLQIWLLKSASPEKTLLKSAKI